MNPTISDDRYTVFSDSWNGPRMVLSTSVQGIDWRLALAIAVLLVGMIVWALAAG